MVHPSNYTVQKEVPRSYSEFLTMIENYKKQHDLFVRSSIERSGMKKKEFEAIYEPRKHLIAKRSNETRRSWINR
jgi:hypothetical protein